VAESNAAMVYRFDPLCPLAVPAFLPSLIPRKISLQEQIHSLISPENSLFRCIGNFP